MSNLAQWHRYVKSHSAGDLDRILDQNVVFTSPVVHTPQRGKAITTAYLTAASQVLMSDKFKYVREFDCDSRAVLEFETEIDGVHINGVDLIEWNEQGRIVDFKVMVRPLKGVQKIHQKMAEMLEAMQGAK